MDLSRTIDELNALYYLESGIRDIFVEGTTDKAFFDWYIHRKKWLNASVYPIELVDVPDSLLRSYSLPLRSKRSRVVALSCELAKRFPVKKNIMCIIDRDSDDHSFIGDSNPYLYYTDGNSLELYAFTPAVVDKFLLVCLGGFPLSTNNLISQITPVLQRLYAIRRANVSLGWNMKWIPFKTYVSVERGHIFFREETFVKAYLTKNNRWSLREKFLQTIAEETKKLDPDPRRSTRGHDLSELLRHILKKLEKTRIFGNSVTVEGCIMTAIETSDLDGQMLFESLKQIIS